MDKVFDIYLAIADQPESDAYAELSLPAAPYEMRDAMDKLRLPENESLYWEITEYHAFEKLSSILNEDCGLYELDTLARRLSELDERQCTAFAGLLQMEQAKSGLIPISRLIDLAYSTECCHVVDDVLNDSRLGRFCADSGFVPGAEDLSDDLFDLLDFERIGREHRQREGGVIVERTAEHAGGYVERHSPLVEAYKTLDLTPKAPDYTILLEVSKGSFDDPGYDSEKTVQLKLPASPETLDAALTALNIWDWREAGWHCLDCKVPSLMDAVSDKDSIHEINDLAQRLADMEPKTLTTCKALLSAMDCKTIRQAELLMDTLDQYLLSPRLSSPIEVAKGELSVILSEPEVETLTPYLNLYQYGQALIKKCGGILTDYGLLEREDMQPVRIIEKSTQQGGMGMV